MQCLTLAIENPPETGEYRVFNQFEEVYGINDLAKRVSAAGAKLGLEVQVHPIQNPRKEAEEHYYNPDHQHLLDLGYHPTRDMETELVATLGDLLKHRDRIEARRGVLMPDIRWDGSRESSAFLGNTTSRR